VRDRAGHTLYTSPSPYRVRHPAWLIMPGPFDELTLSAAVRPAFYSRIVGEVWTWDRAQLVIGLITLSAGLIVVTLFQLRRERAIARLRSEFVSSVSHELRTPLAQIRMFAEMLRLGWVRSEAEGARSIAIIDQEARRLTHLVENVLHFSRIERGAGVAPLARLPIALAPLVDDVLAGFAPLASAAGISVRAQVPGTCVALADRDALRQVLLNLLDNAVKYGPKGQTVCIGAASVMDGAIIQMWVDDEGPGIPMRERARIWEPFRRLGRDVRAGVTGNGIGLAVVRELVVAQHGRTWVETAPGNGARILLELPAGSLPPAATEAIDTPPAAGTIAPRSLSRV
jgi:signal transduction histidine kinase